jgi:hypothetical protein
VNVYVIFNLYKSRAYLRVQCDFMFSRRSIFTVVLWVQYPKKERRKILRNVGSIILRVRCGVIKTASKMLRINLGTNSVHAFRTHK